MWSLYETIDIQNLNKFEYFVDSFLDLIKRLDISKVAKILNILYGKNKKENGLVVANKLLWGLRENEFFLFEKFIRSLGG